MLFYSSEHFFRISSISSFMENYLRSIKIIIFFLFFRSSDAKNTIRQHFYDSHTTNPKKAIRQHFPRLKARRQSKKGEPSAPIKASRQKGEPSSPARLLKACRQSQAVNPSAGEPSRASRSTRAVNLKPCPSSRVRRAEPLKGKPPDSGGESRGRLVATGYRSDYLLSLITSGVA